MYCPPNNTMERCNFNQFRVKGRSDRSDCVKLVINYFYAFFYLLWHLLNSFCFDIIFFKFLQNMTILKWLLFSLISNRCYSADWSVSWRAAVYFWERFWARLATAHLNLHHSVFVSCSFMVSKFRTSLRGMEFIIQEQVKMTYQPHTYSWRMLESQIIRYIFDLCPQGFFIGLLFRSECCAWICFQDYIKLAPGAVCPVCGVTVCPICSIRFYVFSLHIRSGPVICVVFVFSLFRFWRRR